MKNTFFLICSVFVLIFFPFRLFAVPDANSSQNTSPPLTQLSLEELMDLEIYSASKKLEKQFQTPAATYVLTEEDIRRSGVTNVMDALRLVPGVSVQKVDSNTWDISIRGFNGSIFANKLLVMIDGRSVYTPFQGGVFWDIQDVMLEDIERIEVVRGPGGTLWGSNAVNGVINILTKKAKETQGALVSGGGGTEEQGFGAFRYGNQIKDLFYRGYVKYFRRGEGFRRDAIEPDDWHLLKTGFKSEYKNLTFQGDLHNGEVGERLSMTNPATLTASQFTTNTDVSGGNLLTKYEGENLTAQAYWDHTQRHSLTFREKRERIDLDFNHRFTLPLRQEVVWGGGYRWDIDQFSNTFGISLLSPERTDHTANAFVQDEIDLIKDHWRLIGGSKFEHNTITGFEVQPNIKTVITFLKDHVIWGSISRAVRIPSRIELDVLAQGGVAGVLTQLVGNNALKAENLISYEAGYRTKIIPKVLLDTTFYYNQYDDFLSAPVSRGLTFITFGNGMEADVYGFELGGDIEPWEWWKIRSGYSFNKVNMHLDLEENDLAGVERINENSTPKHIFFVHNSFDLPRGFQLDLVTRYVDHINLTGTSPYFELDLRLGYKWKNILLEAVARDLFQAHHPEQQSTNSTQVERSVYGRATVEI